MNKKIIYGILGVLIILFSINFISAWCLFGFIGTTCELESKCYTNLQPSRYFSGSPSPIYTSEFGRKVIIESSEIMFIEQVSNTGSMRPTLSDYSAIIKVKATKKNLKVGDIISINREGKKNILHRIIRIEGDYYITKGDNNPREDKTKWTLKQIDGKVVGVLY